MAMACPCEVLIRTDSAGDATHLASLARSEAQRIEHKFSRYRPDNIVATINSAEGRTVTLDTETARLLHYAASCFALSDGLFDVTSGILRRAWKFDGGEVTPDLPQIDSLRALVGWQHVQLEDHCLTIRPGMEIDLGGLGKEYAVDRVCRILQEESQAAVMVNFGGDIAVSGGLHGTPWSIGIADPESPERSLGMIELERGAVTTSGVSYRHCYVDGRRLGHILDPRTGWPVADAPRSVTVVGDFCLEAGMLSTLAMLHGAAAESFLSAQGVKFHCIW
jgi:thiamine biosynthesis lipoprotein